MGICWRAHCLPSNPMDAGLRRHDKAGAAISDVVAFPFADIVDAAVFRPEGVPR